MSDLTPAEEERQARRHMLAEDVAVLREAVADAERDGTRLTDLPAPAVLLPPDPSRPWRSAMPAWVPAAADHLGTMLAARTPAAA